MMMVWAWIGKTIVSATLVVCWYLMFQNVAKDLFKDEPWAKWRFALLTFLEIMFGWVGVTVIRAIWGAGA